MEYYLFLTCWARFHIFSLTFSANVIYALSLNLIIIRGEALLLNTALSTRNRCSVSSQLLPEGKSEAVIYLIYQFSILKAFKTAIEFDLIPLHLSVILIWHFNKSSEISFHTVI